MSATASCWTGCARGDTEIEPIFIHDYLDRYGAHGEVNVRTGAWNTGWHHGTGFVQWTGSETQKQVLSRVEEVSKSFHALEGKARSPGQDCPSAASALQEAQWRLLRAQTSCNFFWGEAWVERAEMDLNAASQHLIEAAQHLEAG